jgi:carboxyl-terminal processing protease
VGIFAIFELWREFVAQPASVSHKPRRKLVKLRRLVPALLAAVLIFGLGVGVGDGRIKFGRDAVFQKGLSKDLPADLDYKTVEQVYDSLKSNYDGQLKVEDLLNGLKEGLAKATGDPYTEFMTPKEARDFNSDLNGTFSGIGAELSKDGSNIIVVAPIAGYPAEKAGLKPKDVIAEIDGKSAYDLTISEAVQRIRGEVGTKVKLKVVRDSAQPLDFEITREQITIPSVESSILEDNIGYIKISRFADDTSGLTQKAAQSFADAHVKGVVLDLRSDPGGLLDAAVNVSSLWLDNGKTVLQEKRGDTVVRTYRAKGVPLLKGVKTAVLINEGSASASEITAGALKDNDAAMLIGNKSFGKGSVQSLVNFPDESLLKVTIARWYTPAGKNIDKEGIDPDQKVDRTDDDFKNNRDPQKDAAIVFINK